MKWRLLLHLSCPFKVGEWEVGVGERTARWIRTPQVPGSWIAGFLTLFTELLTDYHYNSIIKLSIRWCVWKVWEGLPCRVWLKKLGSYVFQCDIPLVGFWKSSQGQASVSWHSLIKCTLGQYFISMSFNYIYICSSQGQISCAMAMRTS